MARQEAEKDEEPPKEIERRQKVVVVVVGTGDHKDEIFIIRLSHYNEGEFNLVAGGIDKGETAEQAAKRELCEEVLGVPKHTSFDEIERIYKENFDHLTQTKKENEYNYPMGKVDLTGEKRKEIFREAHAIPFVVRFIGDYENIKLEEGKIAEKEWVPFSKLRERFKFKDQWLNIRQVILDSEFAHLAEVTEVA